MGYRNEKNVVALAVNDKKSFDAVMELTREFSDNKSIIDTSGHTSIVAEKKRV